MYEVTLDDVKDYLWSLEPDENAGRTNDAEFCLVAKALFKKYGEDKFIVKGGGGFSTNKPDDPFWDLPNDVDVIIDKFDKIMPTGRYWVTRIQVEEAIPELRQSSVEGEQ